VKTGARFGDLWVISEGIKPGEQIVVEGLQRVRDGMLVSPKTATQPAAPAASKKS
jgi:membrane fusion protein (multidrug efflux system)